MNQRLRELMLEAGYAAPELALRAQKLAELVVLECEKAAKDKRWYSESPSDGWRNPIRYVCTVMKENLGVTK